MGTAGWRLLLATITSNRVISIYKSFTILRKNIKINSLNLQVNTQKISDQIQRYQDEKLKSLNFTFEDNENDSRIVLRNLLISLMQSKLVSIVKEIRNKQIWETGRKHSSSSVSGRNINQVETHSSGQLWPSSQKETLCKGRNKEIDLKASLKHLSHITSSQGDSLQACLTVTMTPGFDQLHISTLETVQ